MKRHKHVWTAGVVIWRGKTPRIKTECDICEKEMIVDFRDYEEKQKKISDLSDIPLRNNRS